MDHVHILSIVHANLGLEMMVCVHIALCIAYRQTMAIVEVAFLVDVSGYLDDPTHSPLLQTQIGVAAADTEIQQKRSSNRQAHLILVHCSSSCHCIVHIILGCTILQHKLRMLCSQLVRMKMYPSQDFHLLSMNNNSIKFQCAFRPPQEVD